MRMFSFSNCLAHIFVGDHIINFLWWGGGGDGGSVFLKKSSAFGIAQCITERKNIKQLS